MQTRLFRNSTGYKRLDAYILMNIIQLETLVFCRRFLSRDNDPCGRQFDQMTQAARVEEKRAALRPVEADAPPCPLCGSDMRLRHGKTGDFWGCTAYPSCRGTRNIENAR